MSVLHLQRIHRVFHMHVTISLGGYSELQLSEQNHNRKKKETIKQKNKTHQKKKPQKNPPRATPFILKKRHMIQVE